MVQIAVKLVDGTSQNVEIDETKTIQQLKELLTEQTGVQPEQFGLIFRGKPVLPDAIISSFLDRNAQTPPFYMVAQLRGGFY